MCDPSARYTLKEITFTDVHCKKLDDFVIKIMICLFFFPGKCEFVHVICSLVLSQASNYLSIFCCLEVFEPTLHYIVQVKCSNNFLLATRASAANLCSIHVGFLLPKQYCFF